MSVDPNLVAALPLPPEEMMATTGFVREIGTCGLPVVGVYLYGSSARGAYRPPASDVDLLVITRSGCSDDRVLELVSAQTTARRSGARIDAIFVTLVQIIADELPATLDLVLAADTEPQRSPGNRGMMFPLDRQDAWECGIPLYGPPVREVVLPVPREMLQASLAWAFPHLAGNFKNPELMLCRATCGFLEGRLTSKPEAGHWALKVLGARWRGLIERAIVERESGGTQAVCSLEELREFQQACTELIKAETNIQLQS